MDDLHYTSTQHESRITVIVIPVSARVQMAFDDQDGPPAAPGPALANAATAAVLTGSVDSSREK